VVIVTDVPGAAGGRFARLAAGQTVSRVLGISETKAATTTDRLQNINRWLSARFLINARNSWGLSHNWHEVS
jgi:hypothetical protein